MTSTKSLEQEETMVTLQELHVNGGTDDSSESTHKVEKTTPPPSLDEVDVIIGYEFKSKRLLEEARGSDQTPSGECRF
ncbi:hypothetical protein V6N13_137423 [Hibiscus sabdariffa]